MTAKWITPMAIPTESNWCREHLSLDGEYAYQHFHGKTREEAIRLFEENTLVYQEDLMYMPAPVFHYYLGAFIDHLTSGATPVDSGDASCFISLIDFKTEHDREAIAPLWPEVEPVLRRLVEQQGLEVDEWLIYGSFRAKVHQIAQRGFPVSFDTAASEVVPVGVRMWDMVLMGKSCSFPIAIQIFRNSGIGPMEVDSGKPDILRIFGTPDAVGGGDHPDLGSIPEWIRYDRPDACVHFSLVEDVVATVTFMPARSFNR